MLPLKETYFHPILDVKNFKVKYSTICSSNVRILVSPLAL